MLVVWPISLPIANHNPRVGGSSPSSGIANARPSQRIEASNFASTRPPGKNGPGLVLRNRKGELCGERSDSEVARLDHVCSLASCIRGAVPIGSWLIPKPLTLFAELRLKLVDPVWE